MHPRQFLSTISVFTVAHFFLILPPLASSRWCSCFYSIYQLGIPSVKITLFLPNFNMSLCRSVAQIKENISGTSSVTPPKVRGAEKKATNRPIFSCLLKNTPRRRRPPPVWMHSLRSCTQISSPLKQLIYTKRLRAQSVSITHELGLSTKHSHAEDVPWAPNTKSKNRCSPIDQIVL